MLAKHFRSEAPENLMRMAGTDLKLKKKAEDDKGESKAARKIRHKYIQVIIHRRKEKRYNVRSNYH